MTEFNLDTYKQLLQYYKEKTVELELSYLLLQISNKKVLDENKKEYEDLINKIKEDSSKKFDTFQKTIADLHFKIETLNKKNLEIKKKSIKKK